MRTVFENTDKVLVAYFSWSGNTQMIANQISNLTGGDLFEIAAADEYSKVYREVVDRAREELRAGKKPTLKDELKTIAPYDIIFIGFPNWCNTFPAPVRTFLSEYDFSGKIIIPFCTHGGGGIGNSVSDILKLCPSGKIQNSFSINGYAASENNKEVENWIKSVNSHLF